MRVNVNRKMKEWVAGYIRSHRREGTISIHVVYSKFNHDFRATFKIDPVMVVDQLAREGFLKKKFTRGGVSIWLPEDEGQSKRRPSRPNTPKGNRTKTTSDQNQPAQSARQKGESEMEEMESSIKPVYEFEKVEHPETGEVDVLEVIRYIMQHLAAKLPGKPEMDGGYAITKLNIAASLKECGLTDSQATSLSRILQEMALIKRYQRSMWGVLHSKAADYFITPRSYLVARKEYEKRSSRNREITRLRRQLLQGRTGDNGVAETPTPGPFDEKSLEILAEAEMLAEKLEQARGRITELETECAKLKTELAERPTSADAAAEALEKRLADLKKKANTS